MAIQPSSVSANFKLLFWVQWILVSVVNTMLSPSYLFIGPIMPVVRIFDLLESSAFDSYSYDVYRYAYTLGGAALIGLSIGAIEGLLLRRAISKAGAWAQVTTLCGFFLGTILSSYGTFQGVWGLVGVFAYPSYKVNIGGAVYLLVIGVVSWLAGLFLPLLTPLTWRLPAFIARFLDDT